MLMIAAIMINGSELRIELSLVCVIALGSESKVDQKQGQGNRRLIDHLVPRLVIPTKYYCCFESIEHKVKANYGSWSFVEYV